MKNEDKMAATPHKTKKSKRPLAGLGALILLMTACAGQSETPPPAPPASPVVQTAPGHPGPEQVFATPEQAADALAEAMRADDKPALFRILGPAAEKIINSGDPVADRDAGARFADSYGKTHKFEDRGANRKILIVGADAWPMPIPLARAGEKGWTFDTAAGMQEIINRRIGRNELNVIQVCRAYVEAQDEFAAQHHLRDGKIEYAQYFISHPGKHDGLYWPAGPGETESPFGPLVAQAQAEGYDAGAHRSHKRQPYHGYYYHILKRQGPNAAGGVRDYMPDGKHMTNGFAMIAFPAQYGDSGVMSFIVNQTGIVYEKNLGYDTARIAAKIKSYDPDPGWRIAIE